jgi:hypothetical protein
LPRALFLRQRGEQVQDKGINVRAEISDQERHPMNHQARDATIFDATD